MLFLLIPCCFINYFKIPVVIENTKLKLALAILTVAPITVASETIETQTLVAVNVRLF